LQKATQIMIFDFIYTNQSGRASTDIVIIIYIIDTQSHMPNGHCLYDETFNVMPASSSASCANAVAGLFDDESFSYRRNF
jgi:hypothetical protein